MIYKDPAHQICGDGKEMCAVLPLHIFDVDEPQKCFIDQRGGLKAMIRPLLTQVTSGLTTVILGSGNAPHSETIGGPATMTARTLSLAPGDVAAWHYHPGPLFNIVTQGTVTVEDGCGGEQSYTVGQAFEEGGRVHRPKNLGGVPTFAYQMFVVPLGEPTTINIPQNQRMCGPVRNVDECANGGWTNFNFPHSFNNQGECVAFVQSNKK